MVNEQHISTLTTLVQLPVMEHFYTLQGEGYHQGRAAYFIRLGGCDVGCVWCDVKDRSEEHTSELQSQSNLVCRLLLEKKKKKSIRRWHYDICNSMAG